MRPENLFEEIKNHYDLIDLVSQFVKLKKVGKNYVGLCPFHEEKTPSFTVSPEKQIFKCFGCGSSGDVVTFYMKLKGLDFKSALVELAERAGIKVDIQVLGEKKKEKDLLEVNFKVVKIYQTYLWNTSLGEKVRFYLQKRGISEKVAKEFFLGYAPGEGRVLASLLRAQKVDLDLAVVAGVLKKERDGSYTDVFRDRLILPIFNERGECVGFGGRALSPELEPKYLNSSESQIFKKSEILYGLFWSKDYIRREGEVFLVEGYFDFISLWEKGLKNIVATCGTALTERHLQKLKPWVEKFYLFYDSDSAGLKASLRALSLLVRLGYLPKVIVLPEGEDPDSYAQKALKREEDFKKEILGLAQEGIEFVWNYYRELYKQKPNKVFQEVLDLFKGIEDIVIFEKVKKGLAFYFNLPETEIAKKLKFSDRGIKAINHLGECEKALDREECFIKVISQYLINYPEDLSQLEQAGLFQFLENLSYRGSYYEFLLKFLEFKEKKFSFMREVPDPTFQEILSDLLFSPPFEDRERALEEIKRQLFLELKRKEIRALTEKMRFFCEKEKKDTAETFLLLIDSNLKSLRNTLKSEI